MAILWQRQCPGCLKRCRLRLSAKCIDTESSSDSVDRADVTCLEFHTCSSCAVVVRASDHRSLWAYHPEQALFHSFAEERWLAEA